MRTLKELLIILRDNARVKKTLFGPRIRSGLCLEVGYLRMHNFISTDQYWALLAFIDKELDKKDKKNRKNKKRRIFRPCNYLFPRTLWRCRKKWLNEQIKLLK